MALSEFDVQSYLSELFYQNGSSELACFLKHYCSTNPHEASIFARYGRWFVSQELPLEYQGTYHDFSAASRLVNKNPTLFYCEGWTRVLLPRRASWACDSWAKVIDPVHTADDGYFGIALKTDFVNYFRAKFNTVSIINHPCFSEFLLKMPEKVVFDKNLYPLSH